MGVDSGPPNVTIALTIIVTNAVTGVSLGRAAMQQQYRYELPTAFTASAAALMTPAAIAEIPACA